MTQCLKGITTNGSNCIMKIDAVQAGTILENRIVYLCQARSKSHACQGNATLEGAVSDGLHIVADIGLCHRFTAIKSRIADARHTGRNINTLKLLAIIEAAIANDLAPVMNGGISQVRATPKDITP